jgi:hypothetical protein
MRGTQRLVVEIRGEEPVEIVRCGVRQDRVGIVLRYLVRR